MKLTALALRNIERNFKKYAMYFFSLSFSVFTAYSFLALLQNEQVSMAFAYDTRYSAMLSTFGIIIMVFVMFFLISSNNSFIKARKKEISTYALFGMENGKIGRLLFMETMIVGIAALLVGITSGIFFSKLTAMILLDITMASYTGYISFFIDFPAIYITAMTFLIIFAVMGLAGFRVISKFELADLFIADKMSEGRSKGSILLLILSVILIGTGYFLAFFGSPRVVVISSIPILLLVISGTYLFFWGGLPKVLSLLKSNKSSYYKGVNLISTAAFSHRMKSIGSLMATIAVLSAVATTAIATGFTLYTNLEKNTYDMLAYDLSYRDGDPSIKEDVYAIFKKHNIENIELYTADRYTAQVGISISGLDNDEAGALFGKEEQFIVYSQSVYNQLTELSKNDAKPVEISSGEAVYLGFYYFPESYLKQILGQKLLLPSDTVKVTATAKNKVASFGDRHSIILNDADFDRLLKAGDFSIISEGQQSAGAMTIINYEKALSSHQLNQDLYQLLHDKTKGLTLAYFHYTEGLEVFGLVCFIGFFMSAVFILMTASLLFFKQVMAAEEEQHQYKMLRKIGMDAHTEKQVITKRLFPVFLVPLAVGILHSVFAMKTADTVVFSNLIPVENTYLTVLAFSAIMYGVYAVVYGIFYFITKGQYSKIVK